MPSKNKLVKTFRQTIHPRLGVVMHHYEPFNHNKYSPQGPIKTKEYRRKNK